MQTFAMRFLDVDKAKTFQHIYPYVCVFFHRVPATAGLFFHSSIPFDLWQYGPV